MRRRIEPNIDLRKLDFADLSEPAGLPESQRVFRRLWWMIISLQLPPEEAVTEEFLAEILTTSRTPTREAVHRLCEAGLLQRQPGRPLVVAPLSIQEMTELSELRESLEGILARNLARRVAAEEVSLARLTAINNHLGALSESNSLTSSLVGGMEFHDEMLRLCDASHLKRMLQNVYLAFRRYQFAITPTYSRFKTVAREHNRLLSALRNGDVERAEALARAHVAAGRPAQLRALKKVLAESCAPAPA